MLVRRENLERSYTMKSRCYRRKRSLLVCREKILPVSLFPVSEKLNKRIMKGNFFSNSVVELKMYLKEEAGVP